MNVSSLRPERSASANSATSAYAVRVVFYLKRLFCQLSTINFSPAGTNFVFQRLFFIPLHNCIVKPLQYC